MMKMTGERHLSADVQNDSSNPADSRRDLPSLGWQLSAFSVLAVIAGALRLFRLNQSFDLFVDEITYLRIGQGISLSQLTPILYGEPFYLHPPVFFYLESIYLSIFSSDPGLFASVASLRILNVALAMATVVIVGLIVARLAGLWAGLVSSLLLVIDPFIIRINSRVLLETAAGLFVAIGYLILVISLSRKTLSTKASVLAGLAFGIAILTKEVTAVLTLGPLLAMAIGGFAIPRIKAAITAATAVIVYLPYPLLAAAVGDWSVFVADKNEGILRFVGSLQTTGFNRLGSVSFVSRVFELLDSLGTTYVLLAIGAAAAIAMLWRGTPADRAVASWAAAGYAYAGYGMLIGTLEEQMFYFAVVPAIIVSCVYVAQILQAREQHKRNAKERILSPRPDDSMGVRGKRTRLRKAEHRLTRTKLLIAASVLTLIAFASAIWLNTRTEPDDAYARLIDYMEENIPTGASVAVGATSETAEFVLSDSYQPVKATSVDELMIQKVQYLILSTKSIEDGTVFSGIDDEKQFETAQNQLAELLEWLDRNGLIVFSVGGRSTGNLVLYDIRDTGE